MKVISVRQPWAWLIIHGGKDIENRNWKTKHRGPILIHASKTIDDSAWVDMIVDGVKLPYIKDLDLGAIIGSANITDVVTESKSKWFKGKYGLVLINQTPLRNPIPFKGLPGIFNYEGNPW